MSVRSTMNGHWAKVVIPLAAALFAAGGLGVAQATSTGGGHGEMEFGKTVGFYKGSTVTFTYTHGFYCDTTVGAKSATGCEVGQKWNHAPSRSTTRSTSRCRSASPSRRCGWTALTGSSASTTRPRWT